PTPTATATPTPTSTPIPTPTATPAPGLVAAYGFNEGSGATVTDASGHGITGNIIGATWTTGGRHGNALSFNGSSSYVDLGNPALLQITGSMTWNAWVKAAANLPNDGQIVAKSNDASGWQFKTSPDTGPHTFGVAVSGGTNAFAQRYSTTVRSLNVWYHVAGVYNAAAQTLDIYVNGVLDNGVLRGTIPASQVNAPVNVYIGKRTSLYGGGYCFNGIIDDVRIYNRALTQSEIQADMNTPISAVP
ncbi:MAG TPA: LamG domain-containing protein, partial [Candidatus Udaeobacter sp.]|nr:LamG domain-containing protein [Candidatus Udaeobacter sp.]